MAATIKSGVNPHATSGAFGYALTSFGPPEGFHLAFERFPVRAVFFLFDPDLAIKGIAQGRKIGGEGKCQQRTDGLERLRFGAKPVRDLNELLGRTGFGQPKFDPIGLRFANVFTKMNSHKGFDHRPILAALGFLAWTRSGTLKR